MTVKLGSSSWSLLCFQMLRDIVMAHPKLVIAAPPPPLCGFVHWTNSPGFKYWWRSLSSLRLPLLHTAGGPHSQWPTGLWVTLQVPIDGELRPEPLVTVHFHHGSCSDTERTQNVLVMVFYKSQRVTWLSRKEIGLIHLLFLSVHC